MLQMYCLLFERQLFVAFRQYNNRGELIFFLILTEGRKLYTSIFIILSRITVKSFVIGMSHIVSNLYSLYYSTMKKPLIYLLLMLVGIAPLHAQFAQSEFGKNRIQYRQFDWRFIATPNFDIYYYDGGYELAVLAAKFAEEDLGRVTELVGFAPFSKIKLYIYQSITDLQQSNIGIAQQGLEVGGQTTLIRSDVEVAFTGTKQDLKKELARGVADMLIFEAMYGGNLKELLQSSYLLNLPEWFMAGAAKYIAEGWSIDMDDYMRQAVGGKGLRKPEKYMDEEASLVGQSIWNFVAEKYGSATIGNIFNLTRIVRNEENSIQNTLGISYNQFIQDWQEFYKSQAAQVLAVHESIPAERVVTSVKQNVKLGQVHISPDGKWLAYTENRQGKYQVKLYNIAAKQTKTLLSGGYKVISQQPNYDIPLLSWKNANTLAVVSTKKGKNMLWLYDIDKGKRIDKSSLAQFSHINDISIDKAGEKMLMSAELETNSDIYLYNFRSRRITKITNDFFDERFPVFMDDTGKIVFASNRNNDTLKVASNSVKDISNNFHLFMYDPEGQGVLQRLTNTYSYDFNPMPLKDGNVFFLSDQRGISHLYTHNLSSGVTHQTTKYAMNLRSVSVMGSQLAFIMLKEGVEQIFIVDNFDYTQNTFTKKTTRQQLSDLRFIEQLKQNRRDAEKALKEVQERVKQDSVDNIEREGKTPSKYEFDSFNKNKRKNLISKFKNQGPTVLKDVDGLNFSQSEAYENLFTADNFVTSVLIDPLRSVYGSGLGLLFEIEMTDLRENHKVNGGVFGLTNINNSSFYAEYKYLRHRLDYSLRYDIRNFELSTDFAAFFQRYKYNSIEATVSYPLNITTRISATPFFTHTRYLIAGTPGLLARPDVTNAFAGGRAELVFDNSRTVGMNMLNGTKFRATFEHHQHLENTQLSFSRLEIEARHYQKIYKSLVFATRLSLGQFFGPSPKGYILGGMDNWIGSNTVFGGADDLLVVEPEQGVPRDMSHLLFSKFVTSMRGFDYNAMNGNSHILFNAELRLPLLRFFYKGTVASNFFRNLQLVGFTDMGAAWTGTSPFNRKNAVNTIPITKQGGFSGSVTNFSNPFLMSYGFGARTMVLNYYMKFDVAWGIESDTRRDAKIYITLGYDF